MSGSTGSKGVAGGNTDIPRDTPAKHWCFTFNNNTETELNDLKDWFHGSIRGVSERYVFQEEIGKKGTPHLQGYVVFKPKKRLSTLKKHNKKIHWEKTKDKMGSIWYCSDPAKRKPDGGRVWRFKIPKVRKPFIPDRKDLRPWQEWVVSKMEEDPDERSIFWIWEPIGNVGKTTMTRYLVFHYDALVCAGKAADIKYFVAEKLENCGFIPDVIVFDLPRKAMNYLSYQGVEEVKNMVFGSSKYKCTTVMAACPHVVIFANQPPDAEWMSKDRWHVGQIETSGITWAKSTELPKGPSSPFPPASGFGGLRPY